ncbi:deaminase domain-containing protein [Apibacter muscae]|uniref:deaminase domain-containing protein n=1 Tax=Apibacter muscae TaxID=2509004 RepID=UPI001FE43D8E|nr:deaminase domain-containing protein [Apibacter muscae]
MINKILISGNFIGGKKESALLKLMYGIQPEDYSKFLDYLQNNNNEVLITLLSGLDDQVLFIGDNNFTGFVRLLIVMFNEVNKGIVTKKGDKEISLFTVVQNSYIYPSDGEKILHAHFIKNKNYLLISQGVWEVKEKCEEKQTNSFEEAKIVCYTTQELNWREDEKLLPFEPVIILDDSDFNLVEGLLDPNANVAVVPAIFLYYAYEKGELANIKQYSQNYLDAITLFVPVTKIATGTKWLAKTFTFIDKWGKVNAATNLVINNNSSLSKNKELKSALEAYNAVTAAMNITSLAGYIGKGKLAKFLSEMDDAKVHKILVEEASIGNQDAKKILDVKAELTAYSEAKYGRNWWASWSEYKKVIFNGEEFAIIENWHFSKKAIEVMTPLHTLKGGIPPSVVFEVLENGYQQKNFILDAGLDMVLVVEKNKNNINIVRDIVPLERQLAKLKNLNLNHAYQGASIERELAIQKILKYRDDKNLVGRNLGYLEGIVQNKKIDNKIWESIDAKDVKKNTPPVFTATVVQGKGGSWLRNVDSEYRMLNDLAYQLGARQANQVFKDIKGILKIVSENPYCSSCQGVIQQFNQMFPNIQLILINGTK